MTTAALPLLQLCAAAANGCAAAVAAAAATAGVARRAWRRVYRNFGILPLLLRSLRAPWLACSRGSLRV